MDKERDSTASQPADTPPLHVILIGNYPPDRQESMLRFADVLNRQVCERGIRTTVLSPRSVFGRLAPSQSALGKWLGYVDKLVLFPFTLRKTLDALVRNATASESLVLHICDHSNAVYTAHRGAIPAIVTCHDLLAIRGALGEETDCPASRTGRLLQRWILNALSEATVLVCDSTATLDDAQRLVTGAVAKTRLVLLGQNHHFTPLSGDECDRRLATVPTLGSSPPFLLHVGSSLRRKNRDGVLRIFHRMSREWDGVLVFAGAPLLAEHRKLATELGLAERIVEIVQPGDDLLEALYNRAFALLFPSRFEGFGWPVIEAQACRCPVVCSASGPIPEVAGDGALIRDAGDEGGFATAVLTLADPATRWRMVQKGLENVRRFRTERMVDEYLAIYRELATRK